MKKNIKLFIGIFIRILMSGITAFAVTTISSSDVFFNNANSNAESENVQDAIDELYGKASYGDASTGDILTGKYALVRGKKVPGSMLDYSNTIQTASTDGTNPLNSAYYLDGNTVVVAPAKGYWSYSFANSAIRVDASDIYNNGRTQGQNDVKNSPSDYGLSGTKVATGTFTSLYASAGNGAIINLPFAPKKIMVFINGSSSVRQSDYWDESEELNIGLRMLSTGSASPNGGCIVVNGWSFIHRTPVTGLSGKTAYYIAVG